MASKSKIQSIQFSNSWDPKNGDPVQHIHNITFENGEQGKYYSPQKNPSELQAGVECSYDLVIRGVITHIKNLEVVKPVIAGQSDSQQPRGNGKGTDHWISICLSHGKDLAIAQIQAEGKPEGKTKAANKEVDLAALAGRYAESLYDKAIELMSRPL